MRGLSGVGYVSDLDEMATVDGREYRQTDGGYVQAGEQVTKRTKLDTRGAGELRVGRATFTAPGGRGLAPRDCKRLGAVATSSTRMNPSGMNLKRDARDRSVASNGWRTAKVPGVIFPTRAAMLRAARAA